jgi:hypothetical protein
MSQWNIKGGDVAQEASPLLCDHFIERCRGFLFLHLLLLLGTHQALFFTSQ